jgi:serine phosphatase RsbU (regulator of sigma subunit)
MAETIKHTRMEKLFLEAARTFNSTLEYEELNELVLKLVLTAVNSEAAMIFRYDRGRPEMKIRFMKCDNCKMVTFHREMGTGVVGWVTENREPIIINEAANDPRVDSEMERITKLGLRSVLALPLVGKGHMIGVIEAVNKVNGAFTEEDLDILTGLNHQIAVAIDNAHLYREVKREALEKSLLNEIGKKLSETLERDEVLRAIMESLKQVVDFDAGAVFLLEPGGCDLRSIYSVGYALESDEDLSFKCTGGLVGAAASSGVAVNVPDVRNDSRYIEAFPGTRSELAVPILSDGLVIGVINLESRTPDAYDDRALALTDAFASQAAISLERARLHESILEGRKLEQQLNFAREIQRSFLPKRDPVIPGYDIAGRNTSSGQVGGDYYDFIPIVENHTGIAIADVSGKGMPAALIMASFRASLIAEIRNNYSIRTIGEKVNALLCESLEPGHYVTGVYGVLDSKHHILTFSNFGHNPPILLRQDGDVEYLQEGGQVLGVTESATFESQTVMLGPGDIVLMFTDGVTEVFDSNGLEFGIQRLVEVLIQNADKTAVEIAEVIDSKVTGFASPSHVFDDLTTVVIKRRPAQ